MRKLLLAAFLLVTPAASAQDFNRFGLTTADIKRLTERPTTWLAALEQANQGGKTSEVADLRALMAAKPVPIGGAEEIAGNWRCRMIKVGGILPLTPYGFFKCRITGKGDRAALEKITGSQRSEGVLLRQDPTSFVFRGVGYTDFTPKKLYGTSPETDEVGLLYRIAPDRLRVEFPAPYHESKYNVMELVRSK